MSTNYGVIMQKLKPILFCLSLVSLFACTPKQPEKIVQVGYLKANISQETLNNKMDFKRYSYYCKNYETDSDAYLATYFPLWKESRLAENFGFYFQLDNGKIEPFDHIENKALNSAGTRFEVVYRSYFPIQGAYVELKAKEKSSIYTKNNLPWLECWEG